MHLNRKQILALFFGLTLVPCSALASAPQDDLKNVLDRLNVAAANFHSTSADVEFDTIATEPVPDTDVQKGVVYYERKDNSVRMGVHLREHNGKPGEKDYTYANGALKLFEPGADEVTTYTKAGKYEGYLILGFGASGTDLQAKWDIKYLGSEDMADGKKTVKTAQLELVAKDPEVRKNLPKVTIWVDPDRAVSLKQIFTLSSTSTYQCTYTNFKFNQSLPGDAFTFKTDKHTTYHEQ